MAKKQTWIVEYLDGSDKKVIRVAAESADDATHRVYERLPHVIVKSAREARPDELPQK